MRDSDAWFDAYNFDFFTRQNDLPSGFKFSIKIMSYSEIWHAKFLYFKKKFEIQIFAHHFNAERSQIAKVLCRLQNWIIKMVLSRGI